MIHIIAGSASHKLGTEVAEELGLSVTLSHPTSFADGELDISVDVNLAQQDVYILQSLAITPNDYLIELLMLADCARRNGAQKVTAVIPYLAYMRQDKPETHHAYSAPLVARLISQCVDRVILVEPHTMQVGGFFSVPVQVLSTAQLIQHDLMKRGWAGCVLVSPDLGGIKRVEAIKPDFQTPIAMIEKVRDAQGVHTYSILGDVAGKNCVLIDDVIASGKTIIQAAQLLKQQGAENVLVYATHATVPNQLSQLAQHHAIDDLVVTNTVSIVEKKYAKLSVNSEISSSIELSNGESDEDQSREQGATW